MTFAKIAAGLYAIWGVLHLVSAWQVTSLGLRLDADEVQGRLYQTAFFLAFFAVLAIATAWFSWRNAPTAYWINAIGTSATDIPFLLFLVVPGHVGPPASFVGPILWVFALIFATLGRRSALALRT
ncbi:hypothetical protein [Tropicibacter sp. Alg240-R139]|uniref:hypothetical protein n=1 Tax=Tropicibacter sp. Alg240-R139 TaxID=2305991 RepID=UPI0013E0884D|nr:hypothetical protein [Tropicibacter sp. Alg240-R139]